MKKIVTISILMILSPLVHGQNLLFGFYSGYSLNDYQKENYTNQSSSIPFGFRAAAGATFLQIGIDYSTNLAKPTYEYFDQFTGETRLSEVYSERFIGSFVRFNTSSDFEYLPGFTTRIGVGQLRSTRNTLLTETEVDYDALTSRNIYFYLAPGFFIPLGALNISVEYQLGAGKLNFQPTNEKYWKISHSFEIGTNFNF